MDKLEKWTRLRVVDRGPLRVVDWVPVCMISALLFLELREFDRVLLLLEFLAESFVSCCTRFALGESDRVLLEFLAEFFGGF